MTTAAKALTSVAHCLLHYRFPGRVRPFSRDIERAIRDCAPLVGADWGECLDAEYELRRRYGLASAH